MTKKENFKTIAIISLIVILILGLLVYALLPELSDFRNSIYGLIIRDLAVGGVILYVTLSPKISMPKLGKITVWAFLALIILLRVLDWGKIEYLLLFIYSIVNIAISIYVYKITGKGFRSISLFGFFSYLSTVVLTLRAQNINHDWWLTFIIPAIIVAVIVFIPCLAYGIQQYDKYKDREKLICVPLLGLLVGFICTFLTLSSMNIYLDTSKPTYEEFIIVDKNISAGARQITTYELELQKEDTVFTIGVSEEVFYDYEINDSIMLSIYSGAFNEPYYIHENSN